MFYNKAEVLDSFSQTVVRQKRPDSYNYNQFYRLVVKNKQTSKIFAILLSSNLKISTFTPILLMIMKKII